MNVYSGCACSPLLLGNTKLPSSLRLGFCEVFSVVIIDFFDFVNLKRPAFAPVSPTSRRQDAPEDIQDLCLQARPAQTSSRRWHRLVHALLPFFHEGDEDGIGPEEQATPRR